MALGPEYVAGPLQDVTRVMEAELEIDKAITRGYPGVIYVRLNSNIGTHLWTTALQPKYLAAGWASAVMNVHLYHGSMLHEPPTVVLTPPTATGETE